MQLNTVTENLIINYWGEKGRIEDENSTKVKLSSRIEIVGNEENLRKKIMIIVVLICWIWEEILKGCSFVSLLLWDSV